MLRGVGNSGGEGGIQSARLRLTPNSFLQIGDFVQCLCWFSAFSDFGCRMLLYVLECRISGEFGITGITCAAQERVRGEGTEFCPQPTPRIKWQCNHLHSGAAPFAAWLGQSAAVARPCFRANTDPYDWSRSWAIEIGFLPAV